MRRTNYLSFVRKALRIGGEQPTTEVELFWLCLLRGALHLLVDIACGSALPTEIDATSLETADSPERFLLGRVKRFVGKGKA